MKMAGIDLFAWWAISISWSIIFLTLISIYLYNTSRKVQKESKQKAIDENSIEFMGYIILAVISIIGYFVQTFWWVFPGCVFFLLSIATAIERSRQHKYVIPLRTGIGSVATNFIFVWVLLGLLVFYIVTIQVGSIFMFAMGNVFVEALLIIYLRKNRTEKTKRV